MWPSSIEHHASLPHDPPTEQGEVHTHKCFGAKHPAADAQQRDGRQEDKHAHRIMRMGEFRRAKFPKSSQRTWKTLEDVGRRGWKTWGSLVKSLGRRDFDFKKKKSFFSFFIMKFTSSKRFHEASPRLPATSSNVFQHLPCALRQFLATALQAYI